MRSEFEIPEIMLPEIMFPDLMRIPKKSCRIMHLLLCEALKNV